MVSGEGRDIEILCKGRYFSGKVIDYAKDFGWYTVRYDDGDKVII